MSDEPLIWVTGASQGIGKALVHAVPWQQARVIGVSRNPGPAPVHLTADLAEPSGWDMLQASFNRELPVDQWVRAVGREQARRGQAEVLAISPGRVATAMHEQLRAAGHDRLPDHSEFIRLHEEGLLSDPADVARKIWSLLDDQDITPGQVLDLAV